MRAWLIAGFIFVLLASVSLAKGGDQRGQIILLNDSAAALEDSHPRMAEELVLFANEKEKELADKSAGQDEPPASKEEVIKKPQTDRIKLLRESAAIIQSTYPQIAKGLIKMADEISQEEKL